MTRVWIDADACMGAGTCAQIVPDVFQARHDGTWAVKEEGGHFGATIVFGVSTSLSLGVAKRAAAVLLGGAP